jgi:hypothetical protein
MMIKALRPFSLILFYFGLVKSALDFGYHNYVSLNATLYRYQQQFPDKVWLYSIGKSVQNRDLLVVAISDSKPNQHIQLRPEAKYIGK